MFARVFLPWFLFLPMNRSPFRLLARALLALAFTSPLLADRIELTDGSVVNGRLLSAENGLFRFETQFAGVMVIAQEHIRSFSTDEPLHVGLKAGTQVLGRVEPAGDGIVVRAADGQMTASPANVTAIWRPGDDSPEARMAKELAEKARRNWSYEASVAITGRTGVSEKLNAAAGFKATLASETDKLLFFIEAERAEDNGVETANRQRGGVDYSAFGSGGASNGWYARTELEKDKIKLLDLRSTTAFGFARKLRKNDVQDLEARFGVNYIYESYANGTDFESPGLDLALIHSYLFPHARLSNMISFTPAFEDFSNFRVHHESSIELPISASTWKLKIGLANDYNSVPPPGTEKLDTTYFTSLILSWK